jgi:hypothetical protein
MTAPERRMTYRGPFDRLRYRVPARNASLRSRMSSNSRTIASKMKIRHAFHLDAKLPQRRIWTILTSRLGQSR